MKKIKLNFSKENVAFGLLVFNFLTSPLLQAQDTAVWMHPDTVHVQEVTISQRDISKYQVGSKVEKVSSSAFRDMQDGNLDQLLVRYAPFASKAMAGGLSTIRLRGTSPDHTSMNFGGLNINSLTLGHSNASNIPLYLFDGVGIQFGSASAINGSGSIGGAIHLGFENRWVEGVRAELRLAQGSFGEQLYGAKVWLGNGKFESVTRAYLYAKYNNFPFTNNTYRDFENGIYETEDVQHNANIENKGLIQEFNYKIKENHTIRTKIWLEDDWHLVQQNMQTNLSSPNYRETYEDEHVRIWADYDNKQHSTKLHVGAGYVYDNGINNSSTDKISTQRVKVEGDAERDLWKGASVKGGMNYLNVFPNVYAYTNNPGKETRVDAFLLLRQALGNKFTTSLNLRQGYVTDFNVPFTPALGMQYQALQKESMRLKFTANMAYSYNVPTFNDRYWVPGGNPDLIPEHGMNYEVGSEYNYMQGDQVFTLKVNCYYMDIANWVLWKPGAIYWYAENEDHVISKGLELHADYAWRTGDLRFEHGLNFTWNAAERIEEDSRRQLEYVPLIMSSGYTTLRYKRWNAGFTGQFMPWLYTTEDDANILDGYFFLNLNAGYLWTINDENRLRISALIDNVSDVDYQAYYGYAMPGISYRISLTYNFK